MFLIITLVLALLGMCYFYLQWNYSYWKRRGLEYIEPELFFGNIKDVVLQKVSLGEQFTQHYRQLKNKGAKHGGIFLMHNPLYIPIDLDIIKNILIKDFDHFINHGLYINEEYDPLTGHLFSLENDRWRRLRSNLTPLFTPGKIKTMFPTILECSKTLTKLLNAHASEERGVDIKTVIKEFTVEVIGSVAFGVDYNTLKNPNCEFKHFAGMFLEDNTFSTLLKCVIGLTIPRNILIKLGYRLTRVDIEDFFMKLVANTVQYREENHINRTDFLQFLFQLKKKTEKSNLLTFNEITAQCFLFFIAGFEPPCIALTFALLELALNPDIQEKLREEILTENEHELTYDNLMRMDYLNKVVQETLRKHPPGAGTIRVCNKDYKVPKTNILLETGTRVFIPIQGIHRDPDYYPEPETFDPERFSTENNSKKQPYAFMAFGDGPRTCLGAPFGLLQVKIGLICMLKHFKFTLNSKTKLPIRYTTKSLSNWVDGGVWLDVSKIK